MSDPEHLQPQKSTKQKMGLQVEAVGWDSDARVCDVVGFEMATDSDSKFPKSKTECVR
jgi:hypothetical protein